MQKISHLYARQFFILAERLKPLDYGASSNEMRWNPTTEKGPDCHDDYYHRLFFCLEWLNQENLFRATEPYIGWLEE